MRRPTKPEGAPHRQPVGGGDVVDAEVLHTQCVVAPGIQTQQHARRVRGLGKKAVHVIAKHRLQPKGHAARPAAHAAGQVHQQRVLGVHAHVQRLQLPGRAPAGHRVAEEQVDRVLVVDEVVDGSPAASARPWATATE